MKKYRKILLLFVMCTLVLVNCRCSGSIEAEPSGNKAYDPSSVSAWHAQMEGTELSDLQDGLFAIIEERITCYQNNLMTSERFQECGRKYVRSIVHLCRERIRSAPMLGDSILCFEYCPMTHALCQGDNMDGKSMDCIEQEAQCIEYCLDQHWRGGPYPEHSAFSR